MKAPDKIYLHEEDFARIYTQPSSTIDDDIEYIRKDALLEKLNEIKNRGATMRGKTFNELNYFNSGRRAAIDELVTLLN